MISNVLCRIMFPDPPSTAEALPISLWAPTFHPLQPPAKQSATLSCPICCSSALTALTDLMIRKSSNDGELRLGAYHC
ncbi:hypothetical protein B0H67DRAFT_571133 [Lasiosphaeris hirsuta]|uniref:Uncharacterized protein n=1 Tax=Lasiosphaeris hirsuta TaxID=260670 RepID=A0AA40B0Z9_9PEZI|nr:hypothetical protein B0H67DRAFT_571133 [Lasiosphaeris hirsuta]